MRPWGHNCARGPVIVAPHTPRAAALLGAIHERPADEGPRLDDAAHLDAAYLYSALTRVAPGPVIHLGLARGVTLDDTADKAR